MMCGSDPVKKAVGSGTPWTSQGEWPGRPGVEPIPPDSRNPKVSPPPHAYYHLFMIMSNGDVPWNQTVSGGSLISARLTN